MQRDKSIGIQKGKGEIWKGKEGPMHGGSIKESRKVSILPTTLTITKGL